MTKINIQKLSIPFLALAIISPAMAQQQGAPAAVPQAPVALQQQQRPATNAALAQPKAVQASSEMTAEQKQIQADLNQVIAKQFSDKLSFPLNETKMVAFTKLASRVKNINNKWDVQIASASNDKMAIEYSNMAVSEITAALKNNPDLTLDQYNELTKLTATNPEFNKIYAAYKEVLSKAKSVAPAPVANPNLGLLMIVNGQVAPPQQPSLAQPAAAPYGQPLSAAAQQPGTTVQTMPITPQNSTGKPIPSVQPVAVTSGSAPVNPGTAQTPHASAIPAYVPPVTH